MKATIQKTRTIQDPSTKRGQMMLICGFIICLFTGLSANAQMDDFYGDGIMDTYLTHNRLYYKFNSDSAVPNYTTGLNTNFTTIGIRLHGDGDHFHWTYKQELTELLVAYACTFVSNGKVNKDLENIRYNMMVNGFVVGNFKGAWNVVNGRNTKVALGFDIGDYNVDTYDQYAKLSLGAGIHVLAEQKISDAFALRVDWSYGVTTRMYEDEELFDPPNFRKLTFELLTPSRFYFGIEHLKYIQFDRLYVDHYRTDFKVGFRL